MKKDDKEKDPLEQLVKSTEWMDGYRAGVEYGVLKERQHPQVLRFGVEIKLRKNKKVIVKMFETYQEALDWADWNYKVGTDIRRRKCFSIKPLNH